MKLGILVGHIKSEVEKQKKLAIEPHASQSEDVYDCNLEAQKTFLELDVVIKQLEDFDQGQEANSDHVKIITDFFKTRWERIKNTDLIYPINTENYITKLCLYIANYLAQERDLVMSRNRYALLMPTITSWHNDISHRDLWTLYLHSFLPDDTNEFCFQIGYLDLSMNAAKTKLDMSVQISGGATNRYYLNSEEWNRVYKHSPAVSDFYDLMTSAHQEQEEMKQKKKPDAEIAEAMKKLQPAINLARDSMHKALCDENYGKRSVRSSYGRAGRLVLQNNLLKDVNNLFVNREQIFEFMATRLTPDQWGPFLVKMNDNNKFMQHMLQGVDFEETVTSKALFRIDVKYNRAVAYCMVEAYSRLRLAEGEYTSVFGYVSSFFARVFPKDIKEKVVEIMRKYLVCGVEQSVDNTKFFFSGSMDAARRAKFNDEEIDLLNAMKNSRAGKIHERICELIVPVATKVNEHQSIAPAFGK